MMNQKETNENTKLSCINSVYLSSNVVSEGSSATELKSKELDIYLIGGQSNSAGSTEHKYALRGEFKNVGYAGHVNKPYLDGTAWVDNLSSFRIYKWKVSLTGLEPTSPSAIHFCVFRRGSS